MIRVSRNISIARAVRDDRSKVNGMSRKLLVGLAAVVLAAISAAAPANAQQGRRQAEMQRLYLLCEENYKPACIRFGIMIGENRGRVREWRREHPNWWWWERW